MAGSITRCIAICKRCIAIGCAFRRCTAGSDRFPELAQPWYASGPGRAHASLADQFQALARRGLLWVDDPLLAAQQFNWLILRSR
jgi:hypothetical protein